MRCKALEAEIPAGRLVSLAKGTQSEVAFIERQGLAAWIAAGPAGSFGGAVPAESPSYMADEPLSKLREAQSSSSELVLALVDLVLGDSSGGIDERVD